MRRPIIFIVAIAISFLSIWNQCNAQNIDKWVRYAYCEYNRHHPFDFIDDSNNFEIMLSLREPKTTNELVASGIGCKRSQLQYLKKGGIISKGKDGLWHTDFAIFDAEQTEQLRLFSRSLSKSIYSSIEEDFISFIDNIEENGWQNNAYSICFSWLLDTKCWEYIADTDEIYHYRCWKGCGWYLFGDRTIPTPGSNTIGAISVTWNDCLSVQPDYNLLVKVANSIDSKGTVHSEEVISLLKMGGYADDSGKILIPIIDSSKVPTLTSIGDHIAQIITSTVRDSVSQCKPLADIDNRNAAEVILCHELMYDIMEELVAEKRLSVPNALQGSKSIGSIKDIIYISVD